MHRAHDGYQDRIGLGDERDRNGRRAREEVDRGIEIAVVPVAAEPGRVRRLGIRSRGEHAQQAHHDESDQATNERHTGSLLIPPCVGQGKVDETRANITQR